MATLTMHEKGIELLISQDTANMNYLTGYDAWSFYYAQSVIVHANAEEPLCFVRAQETTFTCVKTRHHTDLELRSMPCSYNV